MGRGAAKRMSERLGLEINTKAHVLRDAMSEQSRTKSGWATYYDLTATQLGDVGIPDSFVPSDIRSRHFQVNGRPAVLKRVNGGFELMLTWDERGPSFHDSGHPALAELARMIHCGISYWSSTDELGPDHLPTKEVPTRKLVDCDAAVDYRLGYERKFQFGPDVQTRIQILQGELYYLIRNAEIMPMRAPEMSRTKEPPGNVVPIGRMPAQTRRDGK